MEKTYNYRGLFMPSVSIDAQKGYHSFAIDLFRQIVSSDTSTEAWKCVPDRFHSINARCENYFRLTGKSVKLHVEVKWSRPRPDMYKIFYFQEDSLKRDMYKTNSYAWLTSDHIYCIKIYSKSMLIIAKWRPNPQFGAHFKSTNLPNHPIVLLGTP